MSNTFFFFRRCCCSLLDRRPFVAAAADRCRRYSRRPGCGGRGRARGAGPAWRRGRGRRLRGGRGGWRRCLRLRLRRRTDEPRGGLRVIQAELGRHVGARPAARAIEGGVGTGTQAAACQGEARHRDGHHRAGTRPALARKLEAPSRFVQLAHVFLPPSLGRFGRFLSCLPPPNRFPHRRPANSPPCPFGQPTHVHLRAASMRRCRDHGETGRRRQTGPNGQHRSACATRARRAMSGRATRSPARSCCWCGSRGRRPGRLPGRHLRGLLHAVLAAPGADFAVVARDLGVQAIETVLLLTAIALVPVGLVGVLAEFLQVGPVLALVALKPSSRQAQSGRGPQADVLDGQPGRGAQGPGQDRDPAGDRLDRAARIACRAWRRWPTPVRGRDRAAAGAVAVAG